MKLTVARNRIFVFGVALLLTSTFLCAQQPTGSLTGVIEDSQGAIIPGAMITLINQQQGSVARTAITNEDGSFVFTPLQPATYTLVVENGGVPAKSLAAEDIAVSLVIPADIKVVSATGAGWPPPP